MYNVVARDLGVSATHVKNVYQGYWMAVRKYVSSVPLKENLPEEEFDKLRPTVNIPSLGKLHVDLESVKNRKKEYERYKNKKV